MTKKKNEPLKLHGKLDDLLKAALQPTRKQIIKSKAKKKALTKK